MGEVTRVDFHFHSTFSDGTLPPRELADRLAASGVAFAALTDHNTVEGLPAFGPALARRGLGSVTGVEITVQLGEEEAHLLAYGFDPAHRELHQALHALRQTRAPGVQSIAVSMRNKGSYDALSAGSEAAPSAVRNGRLDITDAIALIHRAGGRAFLAHPWALQRDLPQLESMLAGLRESGLDGLEAYYGPYTEEERQQLVGIADGTGLLVSGGSDGHGQNAGGERGLGVDIPTERWQRFRRAVCSGVHAARQAPARETARPVHHRLNWRHFAFHIIFPTLLAIALFVAATFAVMLPALGRALLERKREMIRELTNSAWSILAEYERDERAGRISRAQAQQMAKSRIEFLRYGREGKDYFWVQDMRPRMIMHPYRKDLNGQDVSEFRDARGVRIFVEFAKVVRRQKEGYVEYVWQWKDDPTRLVPKESYVKGFEPWSWIIGTGIYIEDVHQEIAGIERNLVHLSLGIAAIVALLLMYVVQQSLWLERDRSEAEEGLRESRERYRSLAEATTEGTLLVLEGRCRYANPPLLVMLGYSEQELELLDLADVMPAGGDNETAWSNVKSLLRGGEPTVGFAGLLRRRDGTSVDCVLALSRVDFGGKSGFIVLARDVSRRESVGRGEDLHLSQLGEAIDGAGTGIVRARATGRGTVLETNRAADLMLGLHQGTRGDAPPALSDLFGDATEYGEFAAQVRREGSAQRTLHLATEDARLQTVAISAHLTRDDNEQPRFVDVTIEDVTLREKVEAERLALIQRLQTSLLFLHEPVRPFGRGAVLCDLDTPIDVVASRMTTQGSGAALVQSESGSVVGIVTDHDLRARVVAAGGDAKTPVYRVMSSPLVTVPEHAQVYEALLTMEEKGVQYLAMTDYAGRMVGVVRSKELLQFHSYGAIVLSREIGRAGSAEEVVQWCRRVPDLVRALLDAGAHPRNTTRMISTVCDAATERLVALASQELGPAPASFAWLALGSQGRQEQTLFSDQDNAIVYAPPEASDAPVVAARYFLELGRRVCGWLDQAGYPLCRGGVMAQNPRWSQSLPTWKAYFRDWIHKAEPQELLEFSIFFDFRPVCGAADLAHELRRDVHEALRASPAFFPHFAQNSLLFRPPSRLFGEIRVGGGGEHPGLLNLKDAMMPIINFARLYVLRQGTDETNTLERLDALVEREVLLESTRKDIDAAYDFLMRLRLGRQAEALQAGQAPDNTINHRRLGRIEEALLRQSFAQIAAIQKRISYDFLGGTSH